MGKVRAYVDGFNLYHNIQEYIQNNNYLKKDFAWINIRKLIEIFIGKDQELEEVFFFLALPTHY